MAGSGGSSSRTEAKDTIERLESDRRLVLSNVFSDWTRSDRDAFVDLLDRFSRPIWHDHAEQADDLTDRFPKRAHDRH